MITFQSGAETAQIAAANAVMLAQDTGHDVLLQWREHTVLVFPEDTSTDVVRIMGLPGATKLTLAFPWTKGEGLNPSYTIE